MTIHVVESKPVPRYRVTCSECQSVLEFERGYAIEVSTTLDGSGFMACVRCPVCKIKMIGGAEKVYP